MVLTTGLHQQQPQRFHKNPYTNTISSFANPLLSLDVVDIRNGTESLPRAFQPPYSSNNNKKSLTLKQSIYQRSLSIFTNGVSPLLRKKKSKSNQQNQRIPQHLDYRFGDNNNFRQKQQLYQHHHTLSSSTLGLSQLRRKSEPIMFSYDSITNELSKFQAREEKIVKNINLDFEKMLMNDTNGEYSGSTSSNTGIVVGTGGGGCNQFIDQSTSSSLRRLAQQQQQQQQFGGNLKDDFDHYGKTMISAAGTNQLQHHHPHSASTHQFIHHQQQQQTPLHSHQQPPPQLSYKEPFYMVYEDNRNNKQLQQQQQQQQLHHHHHSNSIPNTHHQNHHHSHHNDDNIYEEIDFLTLSSLRAQYADTLSLQSYKKKGGSKRSLASSSFTRWFSTRKKNSPSMSEDENPYIDIKLSKKQRPPIQLPEIPGELSKEQLKRRYIIGSIVDSENSYINSLQRIINLYKKPLEESSPSILSQNKINIIFHRLEQILQCHTIFGIALSQCVREWDEKEQIGDVFIASFSKSMVLDIYSDFINNFTNAMETARKAAKSKSSFAQFLQEKSLSSPDRLSFFGLMVKPVQRFPQFILLLSDLLKHTPSDHHDRMSLQLALTQLESLADRLNERKRDAERHFAVKQLLKDYLSSSTTNSSNRFLLRQDDIYQLELDTSSGLVMKTKCRKLYLLNDMLVCVSVPANRLKYAVSLQDVDVMDDVTPATNNLIANSMLKSKDPATANSSPKHCTVERMYCDLNSLIHDLEVISRVSNLLSSLRYQYQGISVELVEQIGTEIREEIRKKDAQITLIDRSCLQIRIRSKNYKDIICIQMNDPETKKDWLTDVRLAKLALDRSNNPAWDIVNETISTTRTNLSNSIIMHRVPLFVKSLPIFATTEHSMLTCALHYRIHRRDDLVLENNSGVLWICNVNENGSQLGALATNGTDISLIHSYELCDSHVTCIESVGSYAVWIGLRQGRIIVIDASSPGEWQQFAALDVSAEVTCIRYFINFVYVGLITGVVALFNATHYEEPIIISLSTAHPVTCLLPVNKEMFACCGEKIWIINNAQLDRSYYLHNNKNSPGSDQLSPGDPSTAKVQHFPDEDLKPNLLAHCGIGLWVSLVNSSIIKLYHTETFKHLQDVNVASNVKRILNEMVDPNGIFVTAMLATRGLLWIGTNVGVIVTLNLPRLQGVPLISGCLNVALHRHTGPVTILLNLTNTQSEIPVHPNNSTMDKTKSMEEIEKEEMMMMMKNEDVESIYGLYSDLMNVENYVRVGHDPHHHRHHHHDLGNVTNSGHHMAVSKMTWDLANINLSDDSTSESAIYQDGLILRKKPTSTANLMNLNKRRTLGNEHLGNSSGGGVGGGMTSAGSQREISSAGNYPISSATNNQLSPAKSQNSIYDSSIGGNDKSLIEKENVSSSSGIGASSSLYDIAPFKGQKLQTTSTTIDQQPGSSSSSGGGGGGGNKYNNHPLVSAANNQQSARHYETTTGSSSSSSNNKTALLMTGGNGYKRVSLNETTYSSQHAHCCIWEYKL
ncbi:rho guanine nucleotide exchange factor 10-like protein isoform X1 [Dermatophagoides farinae]|uniref:rho guanine nucleotide exchange factor 10-like protein isoform X1 n=1 Tax=Dermatophagoides farinae TaxID=6954 RepID=UPI003F61B1D0